ncbi:hypothetical protein RFI_07162 [Reticulomyxa filosa]|uniref:PUB domain-containing protein n=1 Tax=Reticulomyxa filosa TaxID=46433 RepID=X6NVC9_RETFI|nr:hypothetical protein RFI_07162 [Reticulomyxa filosa]|eukprot:ETO29956.1 hypothetical protein RFI_07162 [Reticulomyxa filosa]
MSEVEKKEVDMFDNESRRPVIGSDDRLGGERIVYESDARVGKIEKQIYLLCKEIPEGSDFNEAFKVLRTVVKNLTKKREEIEASHLQLRVTNEKLVDKLLKYPGALELLSLIGFKKQANESDDSIIRIALEDINEVVIHQVYSSLLRAQPVKKPQPIPEVARDLKVYLLSDLLKHRNEETKLAKDDNDIVVADDDVGAVGDHAAERRLLRQGLTETQRKNKMINPTQLMSSEKRKELLGIKDREYESTVIQVELPKNPNVASSSSPFVIEGERYKKKCNTIAPNFFFF